MAGTENATSEVVLVTPEKAAELLGHKGPASVAALWTNHSRRTGVTPFDKYVDQRTGAVRYDMAGVTAYAERHRSGSNGEFDWDRAVLVEPGPAKAWAWRGEFGTSTPCPGAK